MHVQLEMLKQGQVAEGARGEAELQKASSSAEIEKNYELPDGSIITVNKPRFKSAEALF